jgi:hypothetical protein
MITAKAGNKKKFKLYTVSGSGSALITNPESGSALNQCGFVRVRNPLEN